MQKYRSGPCWRNAFTEVNQVVGDIDFPKFQRVAIARYARLGLRIGNDQIKNPNFSACEPPQRKA